MYIAGYDSFGRFEKAYIVPLELKRGKAEYTQQAEASSVLIMRLNNALGRKRRSAL